MVEAEKISEMLGWATVQTRHVSLPVFLLSSVTKKTPHDKTALLKNFRVIQKMPVMTKMTEFCFILPSHPLCNSRLKYTDIIMLVIRYWCENLSLTLWEQEIHNVFEKSILRRIFDLRKKTWQRDRQLHNAELCSIYFLPTVTKSKSMRWWGR
jgi:hypothetical protein